jgi:dimethylaniline monooxygenase (N-oxide forming)
MPIKSKTAASTQESTDAHADPYWNVRARWLLFYIAPILIFLAVTLLIENPLYNKDFWIPFLWGLWMPWFNGAHGPISGLKKIVFRDFNGNPFLPLAIPLMHGSIWLLCSSLPLPLFIHSLLFATLFLSYDILMLRYDLLQIYAPKLFGYRGIKKTILSPLTLWWLYLGTCLELTHHYSNDNYAGVLTSTLIMIIPMQLLLLRYYRQPTKLNATRVAVIGAGWAGTYAAKWLIQAGIETKVFERNKHMGGLWRYEEKKSGTVATSTQATSSNFYMHASDYPMNLRSFPTHKEIHQFIDKYSKNFQVSDCVSFSTEVESIVKENDHWLVKVTTNGETLTEKFDAVVVASGFNEQARGLDARYANFDGKVLHSSQYKNIDSLTKYRSIVIVGLGESAADIAQECSQLRNAKVYLSGSGQWFADRFIGGGLPADALMSPGIRTLLSKSMNFETRGRRIIQRMISLIWGTGGTGVGVWTPTVPWLHGFVTKSRSVISEVHMGNIIPKTRVTGCHEHNIEFDDGSTIEADLIIDCTGFTPKFPFLQTRFSFEDLHRLVFNHNDPTLSFVGTARPVLGSIPGLAEIQARWVAAVYSSRVKLPHLQEQLLDSFFMRQQHRKRFHNSNKRPNLVDHEFYAHDIADKLGISVPWSELLIKRPKFFWLLLYAPWMAFKYNLRSKDTRRQAMNYIQKLTPTSQLYRGFVFRHFILTALFLWAAKLSLITMAIIYMPSYILITIAVVWLIGTLFKKRTEKSSHIPKFNHLDTKIRLWAQSLQKPS